jgi:hypothetical protein
MLPAPTSIAAAPTAKSRPSCNPAVPPPPVAGAAFGVWLADEVAVIVTVAVAVAAAGAGALVVTPGVPDEVVLPSEGGAVVEPVPADEVVTDVEIEGIVGVVGEEPELQAETATGASRIRAPQPRAVSLAPSAVLALVVRTFMGPPRAPGR